MSLIPLALSHYTFHRPPMPDSIMLSFEQFKALKKNDKQKKQKAQWKRECSHSGRAK